MTWPTQGVLWMIRRPGGGVKVDDSIPENPKTKSPASLSLTPHTGRNARGPLTHHQSSRPQLATPYPTPPARSSSRSVL